MPSVRSRAARLERALKAAGVCVCGEPVIDAFTAQSCREEEEHERAKQPAPRCDLHPDVERQEIDFRILWCDDPHCTRPAPDCPAKRHQPQVAERLREQIREVREHARTGAPVARAALPPHSPEETVAEPAGATQPLEVVPRPHPGPARASAAVYGAPVLSLDGRPRRSSPCAICGHVETEHTGYPEGIHCARCGCDAFRSGLVRPGLGMVLGGAPARELEIEMQEVTRRLPK